jgi:hypothetical protein
MVVNLNSTVIYHGTTVIYHCTLTIENVGYCCKLPWYFYSNGIWPYPEIEDYPEK